LERQKKVVEEDEKAKQELMFLKPGLLADLLELNHTLVTEWKENIFNYYQNTSSISSTRYQARVSNTKGSGAK